MYVIGVDESKRYLDLILVHEGDKNIYRDAGRGFSNYYLALDRIGCVKR